VGRSQSEIELNVHWVSHPGCGSELGEFFGCPVMFGPRDFLEKVGPSLAVHCVYGFAMFIGHASIERITGIALSVKIVGMVSCGGVGRSTEVSGEKLMVSIAGDTSFSKVPFPDHRIHDLLGIFQSSLMFIERARALFVVAENPHKTIVLISILGSEYSS
jgi:hypothetical protein